MKGVQLVWKLCFINVIRQSLKDDYEIIIINTKRNVDRNLTVVFFCSTLNAFTTFYFHRMKMVIFFQITFPFWLKCKNRCRETKLHGGGSARWEAVTTNGRE